MDLSRKYTLRYSYDQAQAMKAFLINVISKPENNPYRKVTTLLLSRVVAKIHKNDLIDKKILVKLNTEQSLALQITISETNWPGGYLDTVLWQTQMELPPLIFEERNSITLPPGPDWE